MPQKKNERWYGQIVSSGFSAGWLGRIVEDRGLSVLSSKNDKLPVPIRNSAIFPPLGRPPTNAAETNNKLKGGALSFVFLVIKYMF